MFISIAVSLLVCYIVYSYAKPYLPYFKYEHVEGLDSVTDEFVGEFKEMDKQDKRKSKYTKTTETFYNLITDFYEYGWGQSFHFAPRWKNEDFHASIKRYEHWFALQLNLRPGMEVLDVGCGIGGPMRSVAQFSGANITGVNITKEHIQRAMRYNARDGVKNCKFIHADFNNIPVEDGHFDAIYDFEATLHSTDRVRTFTELYRVLKPGGKFVSAQYVCLPAFDAKNEHHVDIIRRVDNTNGCYCAGNTIETTTQAFEDAGFKILDSFDIFDKEHSDYPFHSAFQGTQSQRFAGTKLGLWCTKAFVWLGETLRLMPRGTVEVQNMLMGAAQSFKEAGDLNLLTPGYVYILEKPEQQLRRSPRRSERKQ